METVVMIYVLPMLLGQTYDYGKDRPGIQIFPASVLNHSMVIEHYTTDSQYRLVENANEIKDFLDIDGKLSLKIKNGVIDASGEGSYLKDSSSKTNGIELLVKVHFETVTETIHTSESANTDWSLQDMKFLGTHYCRSITYGGDLLASVRISSSNVFDLEKIKGVINSAIKAGRAFDNDIQARLDKLKSDAVDSSSMTINYYASVPIKGVSFSIEGLMKLVQDFPNHVKEVNNGRGNPLRMELHSLSSLKEGYPQYLENRALSDQLDDLEDQFDDLISTKRELGIWLGALPPVITNNVNNRIVKFSQKLDEIFSTFSNSIANMDLTIGASTKPFHDAFEAYEAGEFTIPQKYHRKFKLMQKQIYNEAPELKPKVGGATYVRWGKPTCEESHNTETVISGVVVTGEVPQNGGFSDYKCLIADPELVDATNYISELEISSEQDKEDPEYMSVVPIHYSGTLDRFENMRDQVLACSMCRAREKTSTLIKVASKACPNGWTNEYEGLLMAPEIDGNKGEYICVDIGMQGSIKNVTFDRGIEDHYLDLKEVVVKCGSLPCDRFAEGKPIPCVVCII